MCRFVQQQSCIMKGNLNHEMMQADILSENNAFLANSIFFLYLKLKLDSSLELIKLIEIEFKTQDEVS
jgi:hypothetical protein